MRTLTIGEVLNRLKDEFEDITISKIRFLETEGLVRPERTESGYRKFSDADVERLRYVLRTQRDRYLPLKVIREELDRLDAGEPVPVTPPPPPPATLPDERSAAGTEPSGAEEVALLQEPDDVQLTVTELCDATGLSAGQVRALREHGIIAGEDRFDADDLSAARAAAELIELGLEPRHLRMYRQFADRELAVIEQLVAPLLKQRNPESRRRAGELAEQLMSHGARLHRDVLSRRVRGVLRW